jgi:hypothetical protein
VTCVAPRLIAETGSRQDSSTELGVEPDYWVPEEKVVATIALGDRVADVVASRESTYVFVAQADSIAVIGSGNHVVARIPVTGQPRELVIDADGSRLFAISIVWYGNQLHGLNAFGVTLLGADGTYHSPLAPHIDGCQP